MTEPYHRDSSSRVRRGAVSTIPETRQVDSNIDEEDEDDPSLENDEDLHYTDSADGTLDVTPVNTYSMESGMLKSNSSNSSSSSSEEEEDGIRSGETHSEDLEDDEDEQYSADEADLEPSSNGFNKNTNRRHVGYDEDAQDVTSEWDKALRMGKSNKGRASDFFANPHPIHDNDNDSRIIMEDGETASSISDTRPPSRSSNNNLPPRSQPTSSSVASTTSSMASKQSRLRINNNSSSIFSTPSTSIANNLSTTSILSNSLRIPFKPNGSTPHSENDNLTAGVLPDVLMTMRQKIESLTMFDSDMMRLAADDDPMLQESRESLKRSSQQSISAAVLVSLAHKRYERRRLAAMEIEKVVRSLVQQGEFERVRAILHLLSDDYVRSTSEDARKGGVVALAACAIGMKKVKDMDEPLVQECRDLILASVVHACQDHSQRVRYYACENLCNTVKVIPILAIQHFFILFEILRSLYADVSVEVRKGAEILDRKMKEIVVAAMNSGSLTAESCIPVFARFVYIRNKPTKRLTLTWLQELSEKLIGSPILEYLHLFLGGIFDMIGDPTVAIRQSALAFLQSVLPKLLVLDNDTPMEEGGGTSVNFDKILQALVTTMEHPNPFVRKVAMYWMSRIVRAHIGVTVGAESPSSSLHQDEASTKGSWNRSKDEHGANSAASLSVRNSVPHVLPGILLSIGDTYDQGGSGASNHPHHHHHNVKSSFLPDQTTRALAEQTNACLQEAVRRDGPSYVQHLDGFIIALREELDSPGGLLGKNAPAMERTPYRMDVNHDGSGIESPGWFRGNTTDLKERGGEDSMVMSRLCALHWVIVLYRHVVPDLLKADYAREFIFAIINQLVDDPPKLIVYKSLEVLARITVPVSGEETKVNSGSLSTKFANPSWATPHPVDDSPQMPMNQTSIEYALDILGSEGKKLISRDREVFSAIIQMHSANPELLADLTSVITYMCKLQPSEFVMVSFAVELDRFVRKRQMETRDDVPSTVNYAKELQFVSSFVRHMNHVLLTADEATSIRELLKDAVGTNVNSERGRQRCRIFHILLHSFSHNLGAALSLCLWSGAFRTASLFLEEMNPLDIDLIFLLEIDRLVEMLERPLFRHINIRMLELDNDQLSEGSGTMLFRALKSLLMILPQSTTYRVLKDRLNSIARFRQGTHVLSSDQRTSHRTRPAVTGKTELYVGRVLQIRSMHCAAAWKSIRAKSLETPTATDADGAKSGTNGTAHGPPKEDGGGREDLSDNRTPEGTQLPAIPSNAQAKEEERWKLYWTSTGE